MLPRNVELPYLNIVSIKGVILINFHSVYEKNQK